MSRSKASAAGAAKTVPRDETSPKSDASDVKEGAGADLDGLLDAEDETLLSALGEDVDFGQADDEPAEGKETDDLNNGGDDADDDHGSLTAEPTDNEPDDDTDDDQESDSSSGFDEEADEDTDEDTEIGDDDESDPVEDALDRLAGKKSGVEKRVAQLTARSKKAEARVKELEAELARVREQATVAEPGPSDPETAKLQTKIEQETREVQQARRLARQLETDPDSVADVLNKVFPEKRFTGNAEDEMREFLEQYQDFHEQSRADALAEMKVARREWERQQAAEKQQWDAYAAENFPWLADPQDRRRQEAARLLGQSPELRGHRAGLLMAALLAQHFVAKQRAAKAREKQPTGPGQRKVRPTSPATAAPPAASRLQGEGQEVLTSALERLKSNPDDESAALAAFGALAAETGGSVKRKRR